MFLCISCAGEQTKPDANAEDEKNKSVKRLREQTLLSLKLLNINNCIYTLILHEPDNYEEFKHPYVTIRADRARAIMGLNWLLCDVYIKNYTKKDDAQICCKSDTVLIFQPLYKNKIYFLEEMNHVKDFKHRASYSTMYIKFTASDTIRITTAQGGLTVAEHCKSNPNIIYKGLIPKIGHIQKNKFRLDGSDIDQFPPYTKSFLSEQKLALFWGEDERVLEKWYSPYHYFLHRQWFSTENTIPVVSPEENEDYEYSTVMYFYDLYQYGWIERRG
ncbi:MAG: hypothetical protein JJT94_12650 [Bernardetiaceae bacterium]|nr:hypothetical protein [Bernardetiaceae bacterium]